MSEPASVLAAFVQTHLQAVDESGPEAARALRAATGGWTERIERANRVSWLPLEAHAQLAEGASRALGPVRARELCRTAVLRAFEQPFLKPFVGAALSIAGRSVRRLAPWVPGAWPALYRKVGRLVWRLDARAKGCLVLEQADPRIRQSAAFVDGLAGGFEALYDVTGCKGAVDGRVVGADVVLTLSWVEED